MSVPAPRPGGAALVTGASSGIGAEFARRLAARGHDVVLTARRRDRLEALAAELRAAHGVRAEVVACDIADAAARSALVAEIAARGLEVDVLISNAGFGMTGRFLAMDPDRLTLMLRTNVEAVVGLCRALGEPMAARRSGAIVIVASMAGMQPIPGFGAYAASKAASLSFAESLHSELGPYGVAVVALAPGPVDTEFSAVADAQSLDALLPGFLHADPARCVEEALAGLERGRRVVVPIPAVRAMTLVGRHGPRRPQLALWRRLFGVGRPRGR